MPLTTTRPEVVDGIEYPFLAVNLNIAGIARGTAFAAPVNLRLTPFRYAEDGSIEQLPERARAVRIGDAFAQAAAGDEALGVNLAAIMAALQNYITAKGL